LCTDNNVDTAVKSLYIDVPMDWILSLQYQYNMSSRRRPRPWRQVNKYIGRLIIAITPRNSWRQLYDVDNPATTRVWYIIAAWNQDGLQ